MRLKTLFFESNHSYLLVRDASPSNFSLFKYIQNNYQDSSLIFFPLQNEGSGVWFTTPGRDISTLQASSFYNLPQGQLAFAPTQTGHGTFTGIFHPAQAVTPPNVHHPLLQQSQGITNPAEMVGPTSNVYQQQQQQQQHAQMNWPSNY